MTRLLQDWVSDQAIKRPDATAMVLRDERINYWQLDEASNRLARMLKDYGCLQGDRICILMPKSLNAILSILGILKADCIYIPLDSQSPAIRLARIINSSEPRAILVDGRVEDLFEELVPLVTERQIIIGWQQCENLQNEPNLENTYLFSDYQDYSSAPLTYLNQEESPAYIFYTSGSTGDPKGVTISHKNVIHFVKWANGYFATKSSDRLSGHSPLHFDLSTYDIFGTFAAGAELHLVPSELNILPQEISIYIRKAEITQWFSVPSILSLMAQLDVVKFNDFPSLKRVLWCGEVLTTPDLIYWIERLPNTDFTNLYGPTETTIASSYYTVPKHPINSQDSIPIGKPCKGEELLVLDEDFHPVPADQIGDLYIGGVGVGIGYWRDPAKTKAAFIQYSSKSGSIQRIYRTGDLGSVDKNGQVYFHGRADRQIKTRGYRIELDEIESALAGIKSVKTGFIIAADADGFESKTICCAYVPNPDSESSPAEIRKELSRILPRYMLPTRWMKMESIPLNVNGKANRKELKAKFTRNETHTS